MFLKHFENIRCTTGAAAVFTCFLPQDVSQKTGVWLCLGGIANAIDSLLYHLYFGKKKLKRLAEICMICTDGVKIFPQKLHSYIK